MERKNITIESRHQNWVEDENVNLSRFVQRKIDEEMGGDVWDIEELFHEPGVTIGRNIQTDSRVVHDRFNSPNGFNFLVVGDLGSGKTYNSAQILSQQQHFNNSMVYIDSIGSEEIENWLDVEKTVVDDSFGLNPLRVEPSDSGVDDCRIKMLEMDAFISNLASIETECRDVDEEGQLYNKLLATTAEYNDLLHQIITETYKTAGIDLDDPSTYSNGSPTIQDHLIPVLEHYHEIGGGRVSEYDCDVFLQILEPVREGNSLSQFGGKSNLNLDENQNSHLVVERGDVGEKFDLTMRLLFFEAYEWSKKCNRKSIVAVDDATHLFSSHDDKAVAEQMLRHSRHHGLSIQMALPSVEPVTKGHPNLYDQFDHKLLFRLSAIDSYEAEWLGLLDEQVEFVENAVAGTDTYDHVTAAFKTAQRGWFPLRIPEK